ncbi:hypothetical protein FQA39_LY05631 [Lamprigera yunnana]|nr:hypothetical protein FQA39_LY05631 [Lamprigera yunnana]
MGAKPSTANGSQSPRGRTFSTSSSSEVVTTPAGFRLLRSGIDVSNDRQRARSLSSVPDLHSSHETISMPPSGVSFDISASPDTDTSSIEEAPIGSSAASIALGRVYAAHSLPSHIWSLNVTDEDGMYVLLCKKISSKKLMLLKQRIFIEFSSNFMLHVG